MPIVTVGHLLLS